MRTVPGGRGREPAEPIEIRGRSVRTEPVAVDRVVHDDDRHLRLQTTPRVVGDTLRHGDDQRATMGEQAKQPGRDRPRPDVVVYVPDNRDATRQKRAEHVRLDTVRVDHFVGRAPKPCGRRAAGNWASSRQPAPAREAPHRRRRKNRRVRRATRAVRRTVALAPRSSAALINGPEPSATSELFAPGQPSPTAMHARITFSAPPISPDGARWVTRIMPRTPRCSDRRRSSS